MTALRHWLPAEYLCFLEGILDLVETVFWSRGPP
jgi:hypothetical protein